MPLEVVLGYIVKKIRTNTLAYIGAASATKKKDVYNVDGRRSDASSFSNGGNVSCTKNDFHKTTSIRVDMTLIRVDMTLI